MIKGKLLPGLVNIVTSTTFLFVFSNVREHTNPTSVMDAKQWVLTLLLFLLFGPCVFYMHRTTKHVQHHYKNNDHVIFLPSLVLQTNLGHTPRRKGLPPRQYHSHFLGLEVIKDIIQLPWVYLNCFNTHLLGFETVGDKIKCCRPNMWCLILHLLGLKMIWEKFQHVWPYARCLVAHLPRLKMIRDPPQWVRLYKHCLVAHLLFLILIRNIRQWMWLHTHCFVAHLLRLKMIRDTPQWVQCYTHCFVAHLLRLKMIRDLSYPAWNMHTCLFIPLGPGEGQIVLDKARIKESHYFPSRWHYFVNVVLTLWTTTSGIILQGYLETVIYQCKQNYPKNGNSVIETIPWIGHLSI